MSEMANRGETIVCRCRDVTEREIREAISDGYDTLELIKQKTKVGTGTCGGRTCLPLVREIIARETGRNLAEIPLPRERAPIIPVPIRYAAGERGEDK